MKYVLAILWMLSLAAAFKFGTSLEQSVSVNEFSDFTQQDVNMAAPQTGAEVVEIPPVQTRLSMSSSKTDVAGKVNQPVDLDETLHEVNRLLMNRTTMSMSKIAKAYNLVQQLDQAQLMSALNVIDPNSSDPSELRLMSLYLSRYAEIAPLEALDFVESNISGTNSKQIGRSSVLGTWAETQPLQALDWFKQNTSKSELSQRNSGLFNIFDGLARQDIQLAMDNLEPFMNNSRAINAAVSGVAYSLSSSEEFVSLLDKTKDLDSKKLTQTVMSAWARKDPEHAIDWLNTIEDSKEKNTLEQRLYRTWLYTDTDTAANNYMASADSSNVQSRAKFVTKTIGYSNPEKALNWLSEQNGVDTQPLMQEVVRGATHRNPEFASQHLDVFIDKEEIIDRSTSIYMSFARNSQTQADNFLAASDYKEELSEAIAERQARIDARKKKN